ncbi:hypothetical protein J6590_087312 [Homalodisca vitripennis]|nr:hypothetical protein J6590_087312 [Homalodisca vitripennis]
MNNDSQLYNHKRVQLREEPILPVTLERPTRTERRCQTCSPLAAVYQPQCASRAGRQRQLCGNVAQASPFYWSPPTALSGVLV